MSRHAPALPPDLLRRLRFAVVAAAFGWVALLSWSGLIERPGRVFDPAWVGAVVIALLGGTLRWRRARWYVVLLAQVVVLTLWLQARTSVRHGLAAWVPTVSGLEHLVRTLHHGAVEVDKYASPIAAVQVDAVDYFLALGLLVVVAVDLIAGGLRRTPWACLPVLIALAVPVGVLDADLSWGVFAGCSLLFVMLLASDEAQRVHTWATGPGGSGLHALTGARSGDPVALRGTAVGLGALATVGALVLPVLLPIGNGLIGGGHGLGKGHGSNDSITLINPVVDLRRDLVEGANRTLLVANTADTQLDYLRLTVLDDFDGSQWTPSKRDLLASNRAHGDLPAPPGLDPATPTTSVDWFLQLDPAFDTSWLPAPYPLKSLVTEGGDWRFDSRTLDFVRVDRARLPAIRYHLTALHPVVDENALATAPAAPSSIATPMTTLPPDLPPVVAQIARRVTAGATSAYDRMVKLQEWFRSTGGFTYSTAEDPGSSSGALVRFITTDKIGFCEQFAAAMAIMARSLGVPARVVVGLLRPAQVVNGQATYTTDALHAWPELYFAGSGWVRFEPTPAARTGPPPEWTLPRAVSTPTASASTPALPKPTASPRRPQLPDAALSAGKNGGSHDGTVLLVFALLALLALAVPGLVRSRIRARRLDVAAGMPRDRAAAALWAELLATATDLGVAWPRSRSIRVVAEVLAREVVPEPAELTRLRALVAWIEESRYGLDTPVTAAEAADRRDDVVAWSRLVRGTADRRRRLTAQLFPRSVLTRPASVAPEAGDRVGAQKP